MNGLHDLGGMHGFGRIRRDDEPLFHEAWERRAFALLIAVIAGGVVNMDEARDGVERMDPLLYLDTVYGNESYYWRWLCATEFLLERKRVVTRVERDACAARRPGPGPGRAEPSMSCLRPEGVPALIATGGSARIGAAVAPKFRVGEVVRARNLHPAGHTRLPRYVRGRRGQILRDHGVFVFPDSNASGLGQKPQHVYLVRFAGSELWGESATARTAVLVDLWDDYLERCE